MAILISILPFTLFLSLGAKVFSSVEQPYNTPLRANTSIPFINSTSWSTAPPFSFSYIIPYGRSQECNIYGPICQTGSITVEVNLTYATTTSVLPCSSYLKAQSQYLQPPNPDISYDPLYANDYIDWDAIPRDWLINFGQSPECKSYAEAYDRRQFTFPDCSTSNMVLLPNDPADQFHYYPWQIPPGLIRRFSPLVTDFCCGTCSLESLEVRLYYFPDSTITNCHNKTSFNDTSYSSLKYLLKRRQSLPRAEGIAVVSGHTFTSPSVYLQVLGTLAVRDECTTIGPILTSPIMTFPPGGLSTWKPPPMPEVQGENFSVGAVWHLQAPDMTGVVAPLIIRDLACPTWGLGKSTSSNGDVITTIGPPWLPLIAPPKEAFSLNPKWASICTGILSDWLELESFALFDPPIALTPGLGLIPAPAMPVVAPTFAPASNYADSTTVTDGSDARSTEAAKPASSPINTAALPARTDHTGRVSPSSSLAIAPPDPAKAETPPFVPVPAPTKENDPPVAPKAPRPIPPASSAVEAGDLLPGALAAPPDDSNPPYGDPQPPSVDPKAPVQLSPQQGEPQTQGLGAIIYNAFGRSGPRLGGGTNEIKTISLPAAGKQKVSIGGGQVFSIDPSGLVFNGKTYSAGGPAMTLLGNVYTIVPQHEFGTSATNCDDIPAESPASFPTTLIIAGQKVVPNPTGLIIAGSSVFPGSSAVTISNIPVSLDHHGILVVGSSTFSLQHQSVFAIGTRTFKANPTGLVLDGTTLTPGAGAQIVDGTIISLGHSGSLALGSITMSLPTSSPTLRATTAFTVAGEMFTPNPSAFSIAGTIMYAGGPAITVAGTIISLQPSGTLILGSSTIQLLASVTAFPPVLDISGLTIEAHSSLAVVDGVTIRPGAAAVTVDGKNVSLEAGGSTLDVGTGRFAMPTGATNGSGKVWVLEGGQGKCVGVSLTMLLLFGAGISLTLML